MRISGFYRAAVLCAGMGLVSGIASADNFSFTGMFSTDDQLQIFSFVAGSGPAILQTWGYAGGTNADGQLIAEGGFDPVLSLFGPGPTLMPTTLLLATNDNGGSNVPADSVSGEQFDSYINTSAPPVTLIPGATYFLVLTESPSSPNGGTYGAGFSGDGQGDYTAGLYGCNPGPFCDADGNQRTGDWAVDISGVTSAQEFSNAPEPGSLWLLGSAMAGLVLYRRRRGVQS
jgi:hypothetical protein